MESVLKIFGTSVSLLAGFIYVRGSPYRCYLTEHLRTDRFAFYVLGHSIFFYALGVAVTSAIGFHYSYGRVDTFIDNSSRYLGLDAPVICALLFAALLSAVDRMRITIQLRNDEFVREYPWQWKKPWRMASWKQLIVKSRAAGTAKYVYNCDDSAVRTLHRAAFYRKPIMVTLSSGKVYVGQEVRTLRDPSIQSNSIKLIPLYSGYRDSTTHKVTFTVKYQDLQRQMKPIHKEKKGDPQDPLERDIAELGSSKVDLGDIGVVIMWSEIKVLSLYDEAVYLEFQRLAEARTYGPGEDPLEGG